MTLSCGACGHARESVITPTTAALFAMAHANRLARLAETADRLERERMTAWVESFTIALARDLIDASARRADQRRRRAPAGRIRVPSDG